MNKKILETLEGLAIVAVLFLMGYLFIKGIPTHATSVFWRP